MYRIPDRILSTVVRISNPNGTIGSGFIYANKKDYYLVTAKHVVFNRNGTLNNDFITISATKTILESKFPSTIQIDLKGNEDKVLCHSSKDICSIKIMFVVGCVPDKSITIDYPEYVTQSKSDSNTGDFKFLGSDKFGLFDNVTISDDAFILGYPHSLRKYAQKEIELYVPLLRKGTISGKNLDEKIIILDCEVNYGNSGGPAFHVFSIPNGKAQIEIIGIVSTFIPYSEEYFNTRNPLLKHEYIQNSGYSTIVPIDFLLEIVEK